MGGQIGQHPGRGVVGKDAEHATRGEAFFQAEQFAADLGGPPLACSGDQ
jgi:hypothetical protein